MHTEHRFTVLKQCAAMAALVAGVLAFLPAPAQAEKDGIQNSQKLAQNTKNDEYLPPWQRSNRNAQPPVEDGPPQQISPPPRGYNPPPPNQNEQNIGVYDSTGGNGPPQQGTYMPPARDNAPPPPYEENTYSSSEIIDAGHRFFGGVSKGLGKVVEYAFQKQGRPNGYILGDEGGGAVVAGLRYGEGTLYTKNAGIHRVYWQGPSLGYDFGAEGSKTIILVYNLQDVNQIYNRFAGVDGSAYLIGGVGITFQTYDDVVLAPIRSGVGLRLGANVGYLKYTRTPTWNPF